MEGRMLKAPAKGGVSPHLKAAKVVRLFGPHKRRSFARPATQPLKIRGDDITTCVLTFLIWCGTAQNSNLC
jgi:hypothetical protein